MKKSLKYLALLLTMLFVITGTAMVVTATPDGGSSGDEPVYDDPAPVDDPDPVDDTSEYDDSPWYSDPIDYDPGYDGSGDAGNVSDSNTLTSPAEISAADIAPNEWSNITIDTDSTKKNTSSSFASIKTDDRVDPNDNGQWILWIGYALIALSVLGILYFIVATVNARKLAERERRHNGGGKDDHSSHTSAESKKESRPTGTSRSSGHFADSGKATSRRASKADTAEIYVPRRASK